MNFAGFIVIIFICCMLQVSGVITGPCNPPPGTFDNDLSVEEWQPIYETWQSDPRAAERMYEEWQYLNQ